MSEILDGTVRSAEVPIKTSIFQRIKRKITDIILSPFYYAYKRYLWDQISNSQLKKPNHVGIILDGNRRYSRAHGLETWAGHSLGARKVEEVLAYCWELGIKIVTLYVFSIENFNRPKKEVDHIMELAEDKFTQLSTHPLVHKYKVRIKAIGRMGMLPPGVREAIQKVEDATKEFHDFFLNIAIAYGGRAEIIDAIRKLVKEKKAEDINEEVFEKYLYTAGLPNPDLIIRTSGEVRISGFLLWQAAYSELYFCDLYWPEIRKIDLWRAVRAFQKRHRRFGQ
ncbi:MAG: di-trans,poly-cis-decaprenylcistransferase [Candidatus Helarchaeota archaeon]|nr:di-trans,poly-cis-decaprenylcistransferase [Candidatus Helarchaeota archaeon]